MIFGQDLIDKILTGEKTETRRLVKYGANRHKLPCPYRPGGTYAVQPGRGKPAVARIRIFSVFYTWLGSIDQDGAQREGFPDRDAFLGYWSELHGEAVLLEPVYAIRFALVEGAA